MKQFSLAALLLTIGSLVIGCGSGTISEEEAMAWTKSTEEFATKYAEVQGAYAEAQAAHMSKPVIDMDDAAKAKHEETTNELKAVESELATITADMQKHAEAVAATMTEQNVDGFAAASAEAKKFYDAAGAKLDELKNKLETLKDTAEDTAEGDTAAVVTDAAPADTAAPAADAPKTEDTAAKTN